MKRWPVQLVKFALGFVALAFCTAPVPGDVGGCGQDPEELDPETFFWSMQQTECDHCRSCRLTSAACDRACADALVQSEFPANCAPLVHDGEACLRALQNGSCGDFRDYMSDRAATVPTECDFCPAGGPP